MNYPAVLYALLVLLSMLGISHLYPVHQMRICIQSVDPSRLSSQCVYCKTRLFPLTVRLCTGNRYLPARMTLNEAFCLTNTCRRQLPRMPPEPYPSLGPSIVSNSNPTPVANVNSNSLSNNNLEDVNFNSNSNANGEPSGEENYEEAESHVPEQPTKVRPPAKFYLGKPHKGPNPMRPLLFG